MQQPGIGSKRRPLSEEVASYLRQAIMAGELASGESVQADAVGEMLSVSATPVREALQSLKAEGFLELAPRKGFTVTPLTAEDIRDIFEAHALIAGELAARAARNADDSAVRELDALHHELMGAAHRGDHDVLEQKNHDFHRMVYRISASTRLRWALGVFAKYVPRMFYAEIEGWPSTTARDHAAVIDAIRARDDAAARDAMAEHIRNAGELLADYTEARTAEQVG